MHTQARSVPALAEIPAHRRSGSLLTGGRPRGVLVMRLRLARVLEIVFLMRVPSDRAKLAPALSKKLARAWSIEEGYEINSRLLEIPVRDDPCSVVRAESSSYQEPFYADGCASTARPGVILENGARAEFSSDEVLTTSGCDLGILFLER